MNYSYLMGVKDITELKNNGFIVEEINGNYGIKFEKDKAKFYEEFIIKNLEVGLVIMVHIFQKRTNLYLRKVRK